jgi:HTH-type transcriptional regulator/antitoxin HigA
MTLVRKFPLRPLRDDDEMEEANRVLTRLIGRPNVNLSDGEQDYVNALIRFIMDYDQAHSKIKPADMTPLQALKYLMEQREMTVTELGKVVGTHALASMILHGKRQISRRNAKALGEFFKVNASLFI